MPSTTRRLAAARMLGAVPAATRLPALVADGGEGRAGGL